MSHALSDTSNWPSAEPLRPEWVYDERTGSYPNWEPYRPSLDFQTELDLRIALICGGIQANRNTETELQILVFWKSGFIVGRDTIAEDWTAVQAEVRQCLYCKVLGPLACSVVTCLRRETKRLRQRLDRLLRIENALSFRQVHIDLTGEKWAERFLGTSARVEQTATTVARPDWWDSDMSDSDEEEWESGSSLWGSGSEHDTEDEDEDPSMSQSGGGGEEADRVGRDGGSIGPFGQPSSQNVIAGPGGLFSGV